MAVEKILEAMEVLRKKFKSHYDQWVHLKNDSEFYFDVGHNSPIRKLYGEGIDCARSLRNALDTTNVNNKSMLLDEYVHRLQSEIPNKDLYDSIHAEAKADFESNYKNNYTVQYMLQEYVEQWSEVQRAKQFLLQLESSEDYRLLRTTTPMDVIQRHALEWEQDVQLHDKLGETGLRSQLVLELKRSGFLATSETHARKGHADIIVSRPNSHGANAGNILVVECKIWSGSAALYAALSQLCKYATRHDDHAALVVFVRTGEFADICVKASKELFKHEASTEITIQANLIKFKITLPQDKQHHIPASLLLCNLTQHDYSASKKAATALLSNSLRGKFGLGPCTCYRCQTSDGDQIGYQFKHSFEFEGGKVHRLFTSTPGMTDEEIISLLAASQSTKGGQSEP
jgi:hypothetical protein